MSTKGWWPAEKPCCRIPFLTHHGSEKKKGYDLEPSPTTPTGEGGAAVSGGEKAPLLEALPTLQYPRVGKQPTHPMVCWVTIFREGAIFTLGNLRVRRGRFDEEPFQTLTLKGPRTAEGRTCTQTHVTWTILTAILTHSYTRTLEQKTSVMFCLYFLYYRPV